MNLLFFLTPKQDVLYIYEDFTLRQTLEKWCIIAKDSYSAAAGLAAANSEKEDRR